MRRAIIVTAGKRGRHTYELLSGSYTIVFFADNDDRKWGKYIGEARIMPFAATAKGYRENIDCFIFPAGLGDSVRHELFTQLISLGVAEEDICIALENGCDTPQVKEMRKVSALPYLEIPLVEHCNLNCRGCSHFSPLAEKKEYHIKTFEKDICRMKELIDTIRIIRILGGEPLLHPRINDFVAQIRKTYPESDIRIVTNGILLNAMPGDFWETVKENDVTIQITLYPALYVNEEKIIAGLREKNVSYFIRHTSSFRKPIRSEGRNVFGNLPKDWKRCHCTNLYNGKFSACAMVMFMHLFNGRFGCNYSCEGIYDLYHENLTGEVMINMLGKSIPFCNHCELLINDLERENDSSSQYMMWSPLKKGEEKIEDWIG